MLSAFGASSPSPAHQLPPSILQALERYQTRPASGVALQIAEHRDFRKVLGRFRDEADAWISRAPGSERAQRERVASALAVELSAATLDRVIEDFAETKPLVEWTCERLKRHQPSDFERTIHLAWMAILQGAGDYERLGTDDGFVRREGHLDHSLRRFPSEDRLRLGRVVGRPQLRAIASAPTSRGDLETLPSGRGGSGSVVVVSRLALMTKQRQEMMNQLAALTGPLVRDEALLRRGVYQFLRRQTADAVLDLGQVSASPDKFVSYIANTVLGALYYDSGNPSAAVASYSKAAHIVPATAARMGLAIALFRNGETREAAEINAAMLKDDRPLDPWRIYSMGMFHRLPAYLETMREALR